ncbi:hypothetical protein M758_8G090100 [Ceratodon purpureus]|nr:hypothetical protein M758_8G090100 [Ceratodon purpureus]
MQTHKQTLKHKPKHKPRHTLKHTGPHRSHELELQGSTHSSTGFAKIRCKVQGEEEEGEIMADKVLITFDVDGTLMQSTGLLANQLHKKAFSHAFLQVFGVEGTIDAIKHHGSTDPMVILNTLEHYGIPQETAAPKLGELKAKMVEYAMQHASEVGEGLEVLPGVRELLEVLSRQEEVIIGLVTGNLEDIAWLKMEGLGIRQFFSIPNFGGFGSDHSDRGELVRIAAARADQMFPGGFRLRAHVGDTVS